MLAYDNIIFKPKQSKVNKWIENIKWRRLVKKILK